MRRFKKTVAIFLIALTALTPVSFVAQAKSVSTSTAISKVISVAENEVGYQGSGSYSKYGEWYGYQGGWCTTFVLWCFNKAGESLGIKLYGKIVPNGGNCNSMISWYQNKGRYHTRSSGYTPKKGDLIFFDWSGNGSSQHVGIVKSISGSTVYTIEGNCSGAVKERTYTTSGSKPYNNVSSIMGYGSPDWSSVTSVGTQQTTKKPSTTKSTTKSNANKKPTAKASTEKQNTTTTTAQTTTTQAETTTEQQVLMAKSMTLYAATNELQIGDCVQLDYSIEPTGASAVVGYFCDEENIIELSQGGLIKATGEGVATVVVCANDEIYRQLDFTVTQATGDVTHQYTNRIVVQGATTEAVSANKSTNQLLNDWGINIEKLAAHKNDYIIPVGIIGATAFVSIMILSVKAIRRRIDKKRKSNQNDVKNDDEN